MESNEQLTLNYEEEAARDRKKIRRLLIGIVTLLVLVTGLAIAVYFFATADRDAARAVAASEQTQKQEIAEEAKAVLCVADDIQVYDEALCARLEDAAAGGTEPIPGPTGPKGDKGVKGEKGDKGDKGDKGEKGDPGPKGDQGDTGAAGLAGAPGAPGDSGPGGPPGAKGDPGPKGDKGDKGDPGEPARGIASVTCEGTGESSYWVVTYTDGTSETSSGPCRFDPLPLPAPSITP